MIAMWKAPLANGGHSEELLVSFDKGRDRRILIVPALFDEANKLRRFTLQTMRTLDEAGVDSFLPDLPGCNESLAPLESQTLRGWTDAMVQAATAFAATHVLTVRAGALLAPAGLPGWQYAPHSGPKLLRAMLRARVIAAREAGRSESSEEVLAEARQSGLMLAGWSIGATMLRELENAEPTANTHQATVKATELGGPGLWLRAEPAEDQSQSQALAALVADDKEVGG